MFTCITNHILSTYLDNFPSQVTLALIRKDNDFLIGLEMFLGIAIASILIFVFKLLDLVITQYLGEIR